MNHSDNAHDLTAGYAEDAHGLEARDASDWNGFEAVTFAQDDHTVGYNVAIDLISAMDTLSGIIDTETQMIRDSDAANIGALLPAKTSAVETLERAMADLAAWGGKDLLTTHGLDAEALDAASHLERALSDNVYAIKTTSEVVRRIVHAMVRAVNPDVDLDGYEDGGRKAEVATRPIAADVSV